MRTLVITLRLLPLVLSILRDRRRWLVVGAPLPRTGEFHARRAARIVATVAALGPTFVKLAQVLAARADLIHEPYLGALGTLADAVPPVPVAAIERQIFEAYGQAAHSLFEEFDRTPLAAASLGQVHRARADGQDVVVKVLRPGVEDLVAGDVRAALAILRLVERRWPNPHVRGLISVVEEFGDRVREEMDFRQEAVYAEEIGANLAGMPGVIVPEVLPRFTRQRVMVMRYAAGRRIDRLEPLIASGSLRSDDVVRRVIEVYVRMMLVDGLFHADPHPGNLLVQDDGTLVLLDFGMVIRVPRETRWNLIQTVFAAIRRDPEGVVSGFYSLGIVLPEANRVEITALATRLMALADQRITTEERIQVLLAEQVMETLYEWPVQLPREMVYFARTAALIEGLGTRYDARFNAIHFSGPIVLRLRGRILASLRGEGVTLPDGPPVDWPSFIGGALGRVAGAMSRAGQALALVFGQELAAGTTAIARSLRVDEALVAARAAAGNGNGTGSTNGTAPVVPPRVDVA
jgi:predicted unusual protein kinase regulating ubiquinone biosynthesis (AarF/ABC1/UbiB family)